MLKKKRSIISVNEGFERQLRAYCMVGCDVYSAHQQLLRQRISYLKSFTPASVVRMSKAKTAGARSMLSPHGSATPAPMFAPVQRPARLRLQRPGSQSVQIVPRCALWT